MSAQPASYDRTLPRYIRRERGAYYTPPELVELLLDHGLEPLLDRVADPLRLRIADPACGDGRFLLAAAERIARRGVPIARVVRSCLFGVDSDSQAVQLCRRNLARAARRRPNSISTIAVGDGLTAWEPGTFDAVIGNPPFRNAIEGNRREYRPHPLIGGTADLAYRFLVRATELVRPGGTVAMIQPRPGLNAAALDRFRRGVPNDLRPNLIFAPDRSRLFDGAMVFACALVLGPGPTCRVSRDPARRAWATGPIRSVNWWQGLNALLLGDRSDGVPAPAGRRIGDVFEVVAGMTAAEAYAVRPFVRNAPRASRGRLVTTGLIDPGECLWGRRRCRYLGVDYDHPAVVRSRDLPPSVTRRWRRSLRPKILVAGLSRRLECVLDADGRLMGAVSTFAILHPRDDVAELRELVDWLHGDIVDRHFRFELGASAVSGGDTVMTKRFLRSLPMADARPARGPMAR